MQRIFDDEGDDSGQVRSNPFGTKPISPLDVVAKRLKWPALRRVSRLASDKMGCADTAGLNVHRPWTVSRVLSAGDGADGLAYGGVATKV